MRNKYRLSFFILIIILFFSSFLRAAITNQELPSVLSKEQFEKWSANPKAPFIYINKKLFRENDGQWSGNYNAFSPYCVKAKLDNDQRSQIFVNELYYVLEHFIQKILNFNDENNPSGELWNNSTNTLYFNGDDNQVLEYCDGGLPPAFALVQFQHGKDFLEKYEDFFWIVGLVTPDEFNSLEQKVNKIVEFKDHLDLNDYEYNVFRASEITSIEDYDNLKTEMYSGEFNNFLNKSQVAFKDTVEKDKLKFYLRLKQFAKMHSFTNLEKEYVKMSWQYYLSKEGVNMLPFKDGRTNGIHYLEDVNGPFVKTDKLGKRQLVLQCFYENNENFIIGANLKTCSPYVFRQN